MIVIAVGVSAADSPEEPEAVPGEQQGPEGGDEGGADSESGVESADVLPSQLEPGARPSFDALEPLPASQCPLARAELDDGRFWVQEAKGRRELTIQPELQERLTKLLKGYNMPYGAVVAIEPSTGRVLAMAEHSRKVPGMRGLAVKALYPAASVFKIVTGAALLSEGVQPQEKVCYHGGKRRLNEKLLRDDPRRDRTCATFTSAMGHSTNAVFAKLAHRRLDASELRSWAGRLGFNSQWRFPMPVEPSSASIPEGGFEMAATAAGFGEVFLSPLHGALLAAAVGNKGQMATPVLYEDQPVALRQAMEPAIAAELADMLETTVTEGTARRAFRERGRYVLGGVKAAGKTGSLADKAPFRDYSWFVGFAPKENPTIAVAAVVVNEPLWQVRAPYLGREALRIYLDRQAKLAGKESRSRLASR